MIGYKVVRRRNRQFHSAIPCPVYTKASQRYVTGAETRPRTGCGPLCVFGTEIDALRFAEEQQFAADGELAVFRCDYNTSRSTEIWTPVLDRTRVRVTGTRLATSVTLLERVK